ncbi:MAG: carboxymuconolactone decarboxylase family protein [Zoogloeaceae bacterium]|jgi:quercetin dioxygenase-like cupin family protein/alkylhydroperoxidase/carboxymuconolactone decarboxylase family protein YurZ|nr:carboxymuconolactone decarboxylase family protein [Zoogloeaceae bacterium]
MNTANNEAKVFGARAAISLLTISLFMIAALFYAQIGSAANDAPQKETTAMMNNTALSLRQQAVVEIAAFAATGDMAGLTAALNTGLDNGLTINEIKEILVQMYAYTGFPRSLNALSALMETLKTRAAKGVKDKAGAEGKPLAKDTDKWAYGNKVQIELTGREVKGGVMAFAPAIDAFLKEHLFADVFARGVLTWQEREIATIAALSSLSGVDPQRNAHIAIGKNTGLTDTQIKAIQSLVQTKVKVIDAIFARGEVNPYGKYFTGQTYLSMLSEGGDILNAPIGNVTFEPCARTNWHSHSGGQILLVTAGEGRFQEKGKAVQILKKGDVVHIAPDAVHWHGAAPDSWMSHLAITNGKTEWLEPVTDTHYREEAGQ